jgi:hypothetical protein
MVFTRLSLPKIYASAYISTRNPLEMCSENNEGRTNEVTEVVSLIYLINRELGAKKTGQRMIAHFCPDL